MLSFLPDYIFPKITDIPPSFLKERGIELLLMDFDNTMLPYTTDRPPQTLLNWIVRMREAGIMLCVVSNSRKQRVTRFSETYGVPCVTRAAKPASKGIRQAMERFHVTARQTALVGDQIFTDILGARLSDVTALHVASIHNHNIWLKLRHIFELPFLAMAKKRRVEL